jgi:hyperosmotically inducible protein
VFSYPNLTIFDNIEATVDGGVVTLTGKVTMPFKRTDLSKRVARIDGVQQVVNEIDVLPASVFDDRLRWRAAQAIYSNSYFQRFGTMVNPPIRVIVENGRITLAGVVRNDMDRLLARSLLIGIQAIEVKNALKTDAEMERLVEQI